MPVLKCSGGSTNLLWMVLSFSSMSNRVLQISVLSWLFGIKGALYTNWDLDMGAWSAWWWWWLWLCLWSLCAAPWEETSGGLCVSPSWIPSSAAASSSRQFWSQEFCLVLLPKLKLPFHKVFLLFVWLLSLLPVVSGHFCPLTQILLLRISYSYCYSYCFWRKLWKLFGGSVSSSVGRSASPAIENVELAMFVLDGVIKINLKMNIFNGTIPLWKPLDSNPVCVAIRWVQIQCLH